MSAQNVGRVRKYFRKRKFKRNEVLKLLSLIMEKQAAAPEEEKSNEFQSAFFNSGRIGRRNALPDILSYNNCTTTTADLPDRLSALTTKDTIGTTTGNVIDRNEPSTSQECVNNSQKMDEDMTTT